MAARCPVCWYCRSHSFVCCAIVIILTLPLSVAALNHSPMTSAANLKKQATVLSKLAVALDAYESTRRNTTASAAPPRSNSDIAQDGIKLLQSIQPNLDSLSALQPPFPHSASQSAVSPVPDRIAAFSDWLKAEAPGCGIGELWDVVGGDGGGAEEGNGVVAKRALPPSSLMMSIPRRVVLWASSFTDESSAYYSAEAAAFATVLSDMRDPLLTAMPSLMLALLLMFERQRGAASPLHAYIDVLPTHFSLPLYTPPQELRHLSHNPALLSVVNLQCNTVMQYVYLHRLLTTARLIPPTSNSNPSTAAVYAQLPAQQLSFTWHEYRWAVSIMLTRQNRVLDALCLIPGWDMCNHRAAVGGIRTFYNSEGECSSTYTADDAVVGAGEAVYIYYGDRTNRDLFVYSGFIDAHNANRDYELVWTDDVQRALAAVTGRPAVAADWERIRGLMRKKAGLDGAVTVKLPLWLTEAECEEEKARKQQQRIERRSRRQQAWLLWEQRSGEKRGEEELKKEAEQDEVQERVEAERAEAAEHSNEERLKQLLSLLRIEALQSKEEAMDALRLQSGTGGYVGQLNSTHELRARQLMAHWLQYEQRLYEKEESSGAEQLLRVEGVSDVGRNEEKSRRALMICVRQDGLQLLQDVERRVDRWIADVGK